MAVCSINGMWLGFGNKCQLLDYIYPAFYTFLFTNASKIFPEPMAAPRYCLPWQVMLIPMSPKAFSTAPWCCSFAIHHVFAGLGPKLRFKLGEPVPP